MFLGIIIPDKLKNSIFIQAYADYIRRIGFYCDIRLYDFKSKYTKDLEKTMAFQKDKILDISSDCTKITVEAKGRMMNSLTFSKWMEKMKLYEMAIYFILGGAYGLPKGITEIADDNISLSELTFSHEIALIVLLEQIYRSFTMLHNHPYNK
jgi:23S rRNA (pseudouridine1915-N3)-methyltransferase